jgi:hypothetical protein
MSNLDNFTLFLGCLAVYAVDRESYGSDRCSVLVLTGVFKFLLLSHSPLFPLYYLIPATVLFFRYPV